MAVHSELCTVHRKRGALPLATAIGGSGRPFRMEPVTNAQSDVAPSMIRRVVKGRPAAGPRATQGLVCYCGYATSGSAATGRKSSLGVTDTNRNDRRPGRNK